MLPITSFLSCTEPIDQFECFSKRQKHHAKTYVTGLVAASNKTVQGISNIVLPAKSERALNKFLTEYDWDEDQLNRERLALLQQADDTRWTSEGVVIISTQDNFWRSRNSATQFFAKLTRSVSRSKTSLKRVRNLVVRGSYGGGV